MSLLKTDRAGKRHLIFAYEIGSCALAFCAFLLAIMHFMGAGNAFSYITSTCIYVYFLIDYCVALIFCKGWAARKNYIGNHLWELAALIPVNVFFADRDIKHLMQLLRSIAYLMRLMNRARKFFDTCGFKYAIALFLMLIAVATWGFHYFEQRSLLESGWWAITTVSTVGYGDIVPQTLPGKFIAAGLMGVGVLFIGLVASTITTYITRGQEEQEQKKRQEQQALEASKNANISSKRAILQSIQAEIERVDELSDQDIANIAKTLRALRENASQGNEA